MLRKLITFGSMGLMLATSLPTTGHAQAQPLTWSLQKAANFSATLRAKRKNGKDRFVAWCDASQRGIINVNILGNLSSIPNDGGVRVITRGKNQTTENSGHVQTLANERNIYMQNTGSQNFWVNLASSEPVRFFVGQKRVSILRNVDNQKIKRFVRICSNKNNFAKFQNKLNRQLAQAQPQPQQPSQPANRPAPKKDDDFSVAEGVALGILGIGAAIIGNEIAKDLFGDQQNNPQQPSNQPTNQQQQQQQQQQPQPRVWGVAGSYDTISATDCSGPDCTENEGIMFMCRGNGLPAVVEVPWADALKGGAGTIRPLYISVGQQSFAYDAKVMGPGLVGYWPQFFVNPNDPLIEALQAGSSATISFGGEKTIIGLRGSRSALNIFKAHCGWNDVPRGTQFVNGQPVQPEPVNEAFWYASEYVDNGLNYTNLSFGIPETDALGFYASCEDGGRNKSIPVDVQLDFGNLRAGAPVTGYIQASNQTFQYRGNVFIGSSEWAGVRMLIDADDPVWAAMRDAPDNITYGLYGGGQNTTSADRAGQAVDQFLQACQRSSRPSTGLPPQNNEKTYSCNDQSRLLVALNDANGVSIANVTQSDGSRVALIEVPTQLGTKYSNGNVTLNLNGQRIRYSTSNTTLFCQSF